MRVLLATVGSFGDLHPYIAIALALRARGAEPTIASSRAYRAKVESEGLRFVEIPPAMEGFENNHELRRRAMHPMDGSRFVVEEIFAPPVEEAYRILQEEARAADVVLGSTFAFGAPLAARKVGKPYFTSYLQPAALFSVHDPPLVDAMPIMPWLRRFGVGPVRILKNFAAKTYRHMLRKVYELAAREGIEESTIPELFGGASADGNLILFSKHFMAPAPDFPAPFTQCGFPIYDKKDGSDGALSPKLASFLGGGDPPVVFTLGTSAVLDPGRFYESAIAASEAEGLRAVLLVSHLHMDRLAARNSDRVLCVEYAPHSLLMPRALANVHQGGIGTTAQALRAGRPMIVVPFSHDQPDNARRCRELGVAAVLSRSRLGESTLRTALREIRRESYLSRAEGISDLLHVEDGAGAAAEALLKR